MSSDVTVLVGRVTEEMHLEVEAQKKLLELAQAWENIIETMAEIEPDDDHSSDVPRLEKLEKQESKYDGLFEEARRDVKEAMGKYISLRKSP